MADLTPYSPEWWIAKLWDRMNRRAKRIQEYEDYYSGQQRLRFTTSKARDVFGTEFGGFADNFCLLVVDAVEERLQVRGFRQGGAAEGVDEEIQRIWNANDMDAQASLAHTEALVNEESYIIVWAGEDRTTPVMTVESPFEVVCDYDRVNRRKRRAAMKRWYDPEDSKWRVVLYLPDVIYKYVSRVEKKPGQNLDVKRTDAWVPWQPEGDPGWPLPNPLGVVPVVPLVNMPRLGVEQCGTSEIHSVIPLQDAVNKTVFDQLIASEFVAYPQRYMVGVDVPSDENDKPVESFSAGVNRVWFIQEAEGSAINPVIGQFPTADLRPYSEMVNTYITHIAAITKTPKHYLIDPGGGTNLSGETIKALEAGLVSKTRKKHRGFGESWKEAVALALRIVKGGRFTDADNEGVEIEWGDPETRTEAQHTDAVVKKGSDPIRVPRQQLWKELGYSPDEIARFQEMEEAVEPVAPPAAPTEPSDGGAALIPDSFGGDV